MKRHTASVPHFQAAVTVEADRTHPGTQRPGRSSSTRRRRPPSSSRLRCLTTGPAPAAPGSAPPSRPSRHEHPAPRHSPVPTQGLSPPFSSLRGEAGRGRTRRAPSFTLLPSVTTRSSPRCPARLLRPPQSPPGPLRVPSEPPGALRSPPPARPRRSPQRPEPRMRPGGGAQRLRAAPFEWQRAGTAPNGR